LKAESSSFLKKEPKNFYKQGIRAVAILLDPWQGRGDESFLLPAGRAPSFFKKEALTFSRDRIC
jgi:hypothetical protein